jgi:hypothetical protein
MKEYLPIILSSLGTGGIVQLLNIIFTRKEKKATVTGIEIDNASKINDEWRKLYEEVKCEIRQLRNDIATQKEFYERKIKQLIESYDRQIEKLCLDCEKNNDTEEK